MSGSRLASFRSLSFSSDNFLRSRVFISTLSVVSLVAGILVAPAVSLGNVPGAQAEAGMSFATPEHWVEESYEDITGVHVYSTEPSIHFSSYDEVEPPEGFRNYQLDVQIAETENSTPVAQESLAMARDLSSGEATWTVPAGVLTFGNIYQLRYRLTSGGQQGEWAGWFPLNLTAPSTAPTLVSPADGAVSLRGVALVAQVPNYVFSPDSWDSVVFTVEEGWEYGAPTIVRQSTATIGADGMASTSFYPPSNAGHYRWSAQWIGAGYSEPSEFRELTISEVAAPVYYLNASPSPLSVLLRWQINGRAYAPVQYLDITITPGDISLRVEGSLSSTTVTDLPLGDYVASITATNVLGTSAPVTKAFSVVPMKPPVPLALANTLSGSSAHLTWEAPANDGGSPIDHYRVDIRSYDGGTNIVLQTTDLFADAVLADGFSYRVFVYAVNAVGEGSGAFTAFEVLGLPGAPQNIEIRQGDGFANIHWDAPDHTGGRTPTKYRVSVTGLGTHTVTATYGRMGAQFDGIENGKIYTVTIRAVNEVGTGESAKVRQVLAVSSDLDSDLDGLPDVAEARFGSSSALADTDGDGISDVDEALKLSAFLSLTLADTDGNGIRDADEDCDGDGISNIAEIAAGTNPSSPDTDHDSVSDSDEIAHGTNPLNADSDDDGVNDDVELALGLDPNVADSNSDGLSDSAEGASLTISDERQLTPQVSGNWEPQIDPAATVGRVSADVSAAAGRVSDFAVMSSPSQDIVGSLTVVAEVFDHGAVSAGDETVGPALARLDDSHESDAGDASVSQLRFGYSEGVVSERLENLAPVRWNPETYLWEFADNDVSVSTADRTISILSPSLGVRYAVVDLGAWRAHVSQCDSGATGRPQLDVDFVIDEMPSVLASDTSKERFRAVRTILDSLEPGDRASVREFGVLGIIASFGGGANAYVFDSDIHNSYFPEENSLGLSSLELARANLDGAERYWGGEDPDYYPSGPLGWDLENVLFDSIPRPSAEVNPYVKKATPLECRKKIVVLVTNGSKNGEYLGGAGPRGNPEDHPFLDSGTPVHVLDLGLGQAGSSEWMQELAEATDGSYSYVPTQSDLARWIDDVAPPGWQQGDPNKDTDGDGIPDMVEIYGIQPTLTVRGPEAASRFYSNPKSIDSDKDGIPDNIEIGKRLDVGVQGAAWSTTNINRNFWVVSDPSKADGDNDGLDDKAEYDLLMNPLSADGDGDGLLDGEEEMWGTFAQMYDTDSDNFSDAYETAHIEDGFDPLAYNEKISEYEWLAEAGIGFFCGEVDICSSNPTIPWLIGNIASGILVFGDLRDGIALIAKGDWLMASFCAVGLIPGIGDAAGAASKVTRFVLKLLNPFGLRAAPAASVFSIGGAAAAAGNWRAIMKLLRQYTKTPAEFVKQLKLIDPDMVSSLQATYKLSDAGITKLVSANGIQRIKAYLSLDPKYFRVFEYTAATLPKFMNTGKAGENALMKLFPELVGYKQKLRWVTRLDDKGKEYQTARFWDGDYTDATGDLHLLEVKVGYVRSGFSQAQISKDIAKIAMDGSRVEWHFYASGVSGMMGPSEALLKMLTENGIKVVFHLPGGAL